MVNTLKCYAAGGWFTPDQDRVQTKLENYLMAKEGVSPYRPRYDGVKLQAGEFHDPKLREKVFLDNVHNIDSADFVVANLDGCEGFLDTGTVWEVGYAMAKGIPVIAYQDENGKMLELIGSVSNGFVKVCTGLEELDAAVTTMKSRVKGYEYSYKKGTKVVYASPDNNEENISRGLDTANTLMECYGKDFKWVDRLRGVDLSSKVDDIFKDVNYMVTVIDDRHPVISWLMGQAYARKIPTVSYSNYDYGINIMLLCSIVTHVNGIDGLKNTIQTIKREGIESLGHFDSSNIKAY